MASRDRNKNMATKAASDPNLNVPRSATPVKEKGALRTKALSLKDSLLSMEPAMVIHTCAAMLAYMTVNDVLLEKACRSNLEYSDEVCDALQARNTDGYEKEEQAVQSLMGQAIVWRTLLENAFPVVLVFLVGAWSDKFGRKYPMVFVIIAYIVQDILLILAIMSGNLAGVWTVTWLASFIVSISGNQACFISCAFSYVSDHTPMDERTTRTGFTHSLLFLGITLGLASGGMLANSGLPFVTVFWICLGMEVVALAYLLGAMQNSPLPGVTKGKSNVEMFMELFNFQHIKDAGQCLVKTREGNTRLKMGLLLLSHACSFAPMMGEMGVLYLFCRYQFNWDAATFGSYMSYKMVVSFLGNFVSMGLLVGHLKVTDTQNGMIACASNLVASLIFAVAGSSFWFIAGPVLTLLSGAALIVPRSMLSKVIPGDESGKLNSCIASMESVLPLVASAMYTLVYTSFIDVLPGSFFLISAGLAVPPILVYWWFMQTEPKEEEKED